MHRLIGRLAMAVAVSAAFAGSASAAVRITKAPGSVHPGDMATTSVVVTPRARCTIGVYYTAGKSQASGLGAKRAGAITWTWRVGSNTKPGRFPVKIDCGSSGKAQTTIRVVA